MFSLTVDQEVIELRDGQSQHTQRWILHSSAIGHDASSCDGVWNLLLVVRHLLTCADKKTQVRTVASQEICEEISFVKPPYFLSVKQKNHSYYSHMPTEVRLQSCEFVINPQCGVEWDRVRTRATTRHSISVEQFLQILTTANAGHTMGHFQVSSRFKAQVFWEGKVCST